MRYPCKLFGLFIAAVCLLPACVRPKVYRAELSARHAFEARAKTQEEELRARRVELDTLISLNGSLNRIIGEQNGRIRTLEGDITALMLQHGESAARLAGQKAALERELIGKNERLTVLDSIATVQTRTQKALVDLSTAIAQATAATPIATELTSIAEGVTLEITIPDKLLFDANGLSLHQAGRQLLGQLASVIAQRPDLDVEVVAHTDNQLPKNLKDLGDTWQWSLQRATNIVRIFVRDHNLNPNQLTAAGRGEFYPLVSNETPEGRQINRRIVLVFFPAVPKIPSARK